MTGLTITLCIGKWAKPHFRRYEWRSFGICIGWVAFTIYLYDREHEMHRLLFKAGILKKEGKGDGA